MNKYETIFIMDSKITDEQKRLVINKIEEFITTNGKIMKAENIGIKKLAYKIRGHLTGDYYIIEFELEHTMISELERLYRMADEILKFIVVRKDD